MTLLQTPVGSIDTLAELMERLGGVPLSRIRFNPPPGRATESDVLSMEANGNRLFELVDGVLVEKTMGFIESILALAIAEAIRMFVKQGNLGIVTGADGMLRLAPGLVRIPDVAYISWHRLPGGRLPKESIPNLAPDLAVEVLSEGNTAAEMRRKMGEYFDVGVRLVWLFDPRKRTATVHRSADEFRVLTEADDLDGGAVLPGFRLSLRNLFAELDARQSPA